MNDTNESAGSIILAALWALCNVLIIIVGFGLNYLQAGSVAACGPTHTCDISLVNATVIGLPIAGGTILVMTTILALVLARRHRSILFAPACGTLASVGCVALAIGVSTAATS